MAGIVLLAGAAAAQALPESGVTGYDFFYATLPGPTSQLYALKLTQSAAPIAVGTPVANVPSRWAHRRRTLGALETAIAAVPGEVFLTPMGDGVGTGALHLVDLRALPAVSTDLEPTGNPTAYDVALLPSLDFAFTVEDDGAGNSLLRGFSYATPGTLTPLDPPVLTLAGPPSAYVNRIGVDTNTGNLHVVTATGVHVVSVSSTSPQMTAGTFIASAPAFPTTNPSSFELGGTTTWVVGTSAYDMSNAPLEAGYRAWDASGATSAGTFGAVPTVPSKRWVPAVGAEELAVIGNGTDAYVYYLLREPGPGTFFVKPSAIGVVRFLGAAAPVVSTISMPDDVGEPFANPSVSGTRFAFESSFGPPFTSSPAGGGEKISILYSPLDPLGASSTDGVLGVPGPLGGRISTKGMDRPIWTPDGTRVMGATSHFPGAPNPGIPGLEVLEVPAAVPVDPFTSPHTVVANLPFPNQSIVYPSVFTPRNPALVGPLAGLTFFGNLFNQGTASLLVAPFGELGQVQLDSTGFVQPPSVPNFRSILPPFFDDAVASLVTIPDSFGARRTSFNAVPSLGLLGVTMVAAIDDQVLVQLTGFNVFASLGFVSPLPTIPVALPAGSTTTTEFYSL